MKECLAIVRKVSGTRFRIDFYCVINSVLSANSILNLMLAFRAEKTLMTVEIDALLFPFSNFEICAF